MSIKKLSIYNKIGYTLSKPKKGDEINFENIIIIDDKGNKIKLYRKISKNKVFDDITNFSNTWKIFKSKI